MPENDAKPLPKAKVRRSIQTAITDAKAFVNQQLWDRDLAALPRIKRLAFSLCRICTIVTKGFISDRCALQASALTYISLMSMVPVLALMLSLSKGFGAQEVLMETIGIRRVQSTAAADARPPLDNSASGAEVPQTQPDPEGLGIDMNSPFEVIEGSKLSELPPQAAKVIQVLLAYVDNTNFRTLGVVGLLFLLVSVLKAAGKVEQSFNLIWGIHESRSIYRKFSDYLSVLIVVPVLVMGATSVNTALSSGRVVEVVQSLSGPLFFIYQELLRMTGIGFIIIAFAFLYLFMPNTRVKLFPALIAGIVGGILWYIAQFFYIEAQVGTAKYNAIYGTFAAVPLFLVWLYANWVIVLFGAEVCFAAQNHKTYVLEGLVDQISVAARQMLGVVLTYEASRAFCEGNNKWDAEAFREQHAIPVRLQEDVLSVLVERGVLLAVANEPSIYVPGKDVGRISIADIEDAFRGLEDPYVSRFSSMPPFTSDEGYTQAYTKFSAMLSDMTFRKMVDA
ncbi:MAG: YihY/virulence factor BrkB family protein [Lentisphaerae bacterium]|jgi:membrane protein|nr:YihY/virulence factor BrkB family protein [Lentisphaerota bacterium]MBT4816213.1 YihY/virulence factor BrkB family protein [Lentisphaerota bacterium]MBT5610310.1 YihY/virulence factor BrkB family protein [Lentisphaerota bacterium]MBT7056399.1 YihY/virulence factor BrkB family protein [Lentisphaerota bacterium]MBT7848229.1 YihY/virulence factor BrkB family protein [Lentisphaerota bacterium]